MEYSLFQFLQLNVELDVSIALQATYVIKPQTVTRES
jgi:hypothetical protein